MYGCFYFITGTAYTLLVDLLSSVSNEEQISLDDFTKTKFATVLNHNNMKAYGGVEACDSFF
jgi:hypothetical protein